MTTARRRGLRWQGYWWLSYSIVVVVAVMSWRSRGRSATTTRSSSSSNVVAPLHMKWRTLHSIAKSAGANEIQEFRENKGTSTTPRLTFICTVAERFPPLYWNFDFLQMLFYENIDRRRHSSRPCHDHLRNFVPSYCRAEVGASRSAWNAIRSICCCAIRATAAVLMVS